MQSQALLALPAALMVEALETARIEGETCCHWSLFHGTNFEIKDSFLPVLVVTALTLTRRLRL